jgi:hypothetical protein
VSLFPQFCLFNFYFSISFMPSKRAALPSKRAAVTAPNGVKEFFRISVVVDVDRARSHPTNAPRLTLLEEDFFDAICSFF